MWLRARIPELLLKIVQKHAHVLRDITDINSLMHCRRRTPHVAADEASPAKVEHVQQCSDCRQHGIGNKRWLALKLHQPHSGQFRAATEWQALTLLNSSQSSSDSWDIRQWRSTQYGMTTMSASASLSTCTAPRMLVFKQSILRPVRRQPGVLSSKCGGGKRSAQLVNKIGWR